MVFFRVRYFDLFPNLENLERIFCRILSHETFFL